MEAFRAYLQQEFSRRSSKNPRYSLRSFARQLGVNHATLSTLLSGSRTITSDTVRKLGVALELGPEAIERFLNDRPTMAAEAPANSYFYLRQDVFASMSEWYFDAILELAKIRKVKLQASVVSAALGIPLMQAQIALETLERVHLLKKMPSGAYKIQQTDSTNILDPDFTNTAKKKHQRGLLEKSIEALDEVSSAERDHTSVTIAMQKKDLPEAKEMIKSFRRRFDRFLQREGARPDEVYQLQVSFFPLSQLTEKS